MQNSDTKKTVTLEKDKVRQTTHWDLDYLPSREVELLYATPVDREDERPSESPAADNRLTNSRLGLLCMAAGIGLLALAFWAARLLG
jgi:hypothetical protein